MPDSTTGILPWLFDGVVVLLVIGILYLLIQRTRITADLRQIKRDSFLLTEMTKELAEGALHLRGAMEFQNSLLVRLLKGYEVSETVLTVADQRFLEDETRIGKSLQTLMLFSEDRVRKESAFKQLSERFGDMETLRRLEALLRYESDPEQRANLLRAIRQLGQRSGATHSEMQEVSGGKRVNDQQGLRSRATALPVSVAVGILCLTAAGAFPGGLTPFQGFLIGFGVALVIVTYVLATSAPRYSRKVDGPREPGGRSRENLVAR